MRFRAEISGEPDIEKSAWQCAAVFTLAAFVENAGRTLADRDLMDSCGSGGLEHSLIKLLRRLRCVADFGQLTPVPR
jgi:hypothetical protein